MPGEAPPSRYRITEYKGQITVTDTWAEGGRSRQETTSVRSAPAAPRTPGAALSPRGRDAAAVVPSLITRVALAACGGMVDADGRPVFTTASWFDEAAPRKIVLDPAGAQRLGWSVIALAGLVAATFLSVVWFGWPGIVLALVLLQAGLGKRRHAVAARWLAGFPTLPRP